jgi:uncharacterized protein YbjT (DUF2867 family)
MDALSATDTIAIFGGSGATGKALISTALDEGLNVRALARRAGAIDPGQLRLEVLEGSLSSRDDMLATLQGCCAAICVFGPRPPYVDVFCEQATARIVDAMRELGIRRLVCQTGGMIGKYPGNRTLPFQFMADAFKRRSPQVAADREAQECVVMESDLAWTIIKPPRLTDGQAKGRWEAGPEVRVGMLSSITRDDLAAFLLAETLVPEHTGRAVFIRN